MKTGFTVFLIIISLLAFAGVLYRVFFYVAGDACVEDMRAYWQAEKLPYDSKDLYRFCRDRKE